MHIETSPSGRAACRGCKQKIEKGVLRFAETYVIPGTDQEGSRYFHLKCAAAKLGPQLTEAMAAYDGEIPDKEEIEEAIKKAPAKKGGPPKGKFPAADHAPTGRARCIQCNEAIEKASWRVAVEREIDTGTFVTKGAGYMHPGCASEWNESNNPGDYDGWVASVIENSALNDGDAAELKGLLQPE
jgi:hypothetical protein